MPVDQYCRVRGGMPNTTVCRPSYYSERSHLAYLALPFFCFQVYVGLLCEVPDKLQLFCNKFASYRQTKAELGQPQST